MFVLADPSKDNSRYLLIGGVPKSGTTSLFRYLADHPEVCPASRKETYFFAPEFDYEQVGKSRASITVFGKYFSHCNQNHLRIEATPYTLYAKDAAHEIATLLPNAVVLFILRDPVERLISDYYFHVQRQHPHVQNSFDAFVEYQSRQKGKVPNLLELGCYLDYIHPFLSKLGQQRVLIMTFEELIANPGDALKRLCLRLNIDEGFYAEYNFKVHNRTINDVRYNWLNRVYMRLEPAAARLREDVMHYPQVHKLFENVMNVGKSAYQALNGRKSKGRELVSDETRQALVEFYYPYTQSLIEELGCSVYWKSFVQRKGVKKV